MSDKNEEASAHVTHMYVDAMKEANIHLNLLSADDINKRWPQFKFTDNVFGGYKIESIKLSVLKIEYFTGVYDSEAGLVDAAMGNAVHQQLAEAHGVKIITKTRVTRLENTTNGMQVRVLGNVLFQPRSVIC